jgi:hypothetical protein
LSNNMDHLHDLELFDRRTTIELDRNSSHDFPDNTSSQFFVAVLYGNVSLYRKDKTAPLAGQVLSSQDSEDLLDSATIGVSSHERR